jgi:hypothetical protein
VGLNEYYVGGREVSFQPDKKEKKSNGFKNTRI